MLLIHFFVNGEERLFPSRDSYLHAAGGERCLDFPVYFLDQISAAAARLGHCFGQNSIAPRLQVAEGQVLQLPVGLIQSQSVGDRSIDIERF